MSSPFNFTRGSDNRPVKKAIQPTERPSVGNASAIGREQVNLNNLIINGENISIQPESITYLNVQNEGVGEAGRAVILNEDLGVENINEISTTELYVDGELVTGLVNKGASVSNSIYLNGIQPGLAREKKIISANDNEEVENVNMESSIVKYNDGTMDSDKNEIMQSPLTFGSSTEDNYSYLKFNKITNYFYGAGNFRKIKDLWYHTLVGSTTTITFFEDVEKINGGSFQKVFTINNSTRSDTISNNDIAYDPVMDRYLIPIANGTNFSMNISPSGNPSTWTNDSIWQVVSIATLASSRINAPSVKWSSLLNKFITIAENKFYTSDNGDVWTLMSTITTGNNGFMNPFICHEDYIAVGTSTLNTSMAFSTNGVNWSIKTGETTTRTYGMQYIPDEDVIFISGDSTGARIKASTMSNMATITAGANMVSTSFNSNTKTHIDYYNEEGHRFAIINTNGGTGHALYDFKTGSQTFSQNTNFNGTFANGKIYIFSRFIITPFTSTRLIQYDIDFNRAFSPKKKNIIVEPEVFLNFESCSRAIIRDFQWVPKINKYLAIGFANDTYATAEYANVCLYHSDDLVNFKFIRDLNSSTINKLLVEEESGFVYCTTILSNSVSIFSNYGKDFVSNYTSVSGIKYFEYSKYFGFIVVGSDTSGVVLLNGMSFLRIAFEVGYTNINTFSYSHRDGYPIFSGGSIVYSFTTVSTPQTLFLSTQPIVTNGSRSNPLTNPINNINIRNFNTGPRTGGLLTNARSNDYTLPLFIEELGLVVRIRFSSGWSSSHKISYQPLINASYAPIEDWKEITLSSAYFQENNIWTPSLKYDSNSGRLYIVGNSDLQRTKLSAYNLSLDKAPFMKNQLSSYYSRNDSGEEIFPLETIVSSGDFNDISYSTGTYIACSNNNLYIGNKISKMSSVSLLGNWNSISSSLSHFVVAGNNKIAVASIEMNSQDISFNILSGNGLGDTEWKSVYYSDEIKLWAMCGTNKLAFSSNAINWNILDITGSWKKIKYCNGYWIAVGLNSICFTTQQSPTNSSNISQLTLAGDWKDVEFGGRWIITGAGKTMATISFNKINSSSDWEVLSNMNGKNFNSILYIESLNQYVLAGQHLSIYIQSRNKFFNPTDNLINNLDGKIVKCSMWSERYKSVIMCGNQFIVGSRMMQTGIDNSLFKNDFMDASSYLSTNSFIKVSDISNSTNKFNGYLSIESNTNSNNLLSLKNNTTGDTVVIGAPDVNKFNINVPSSLNLNTDSLRIEGVEVDRNLSLTSLKVDIPGVVGNSKFVSTNSNESITNISHINAGGLIIDDELYSNTIPNTMVGVTNGIVSPDKAVKLDSLKNISEVNSLKTNTIEMDNLTLYSKNANREVLPWNSGIKTMDGGTYNINDVCYSSSMDIYIALPAYNGVSNLTTEVEKCYILLSKDGQKWYKSYTGLNIILKFVIPIEKMNASLPAFTERRSGLLLFTDGTAFNGLKTFFTPDCINFYPFNYTSTDITSLSIGHNFFLDENTNIISAYNNTTALNLTGVSSSPTRPGTNFKYVFINGNAYMGLVGNNFGFNSGSLVSTSLTASGTVNYAVRVVGLSGTDSNVDWIYVADSGRILYRNTNGTNDSVQGVANTSQVIDASCNFTRIAYNPVIRRLLITATNGKIYISNVGSKTEWVEVVNNKSNLFSMEWSNIRSVENKGFALWHLDNSSNVRTSSKICIVNANGQFQQGYQTLRRNYGIGDYADGMYVLPINETGWGDKIAYSKDGIDWDFSLYLSTEIISVVFFPEINKFVACGSRTVYTSEDAISWTLSYTHENTSAYALRAVYMSDRSRVAIAFANLSEKQFIHSNDCQTWTEVNISSEMISNLTSISYSPTLSRIVLSINRPEYQGALYSNDLLTFQLCVNQDTNSSLRPGGRNLMWIKEGGFFCMYAVWQWAQWISNDGINWRVDYFKDKGTSSDITISNTFDALNNIFVPSHGDLISFHISGAGSQICRVSNQIFKILAPVNANSTGNDYNLLIYNYDRNEILAYKSKEGGRKGDVFYVLDLEDLNDITTKEICVDYINKLYNDKLPINNYLETNNIIPLPNSTLDGGAEDSSLLTAMYNNLTIYTNNLDSFTPNEIFWCKELETLFISTNNSVVRTNNGVDFVTCISNFRAMSICYSPSLSRLVAVSSHSTGGRVATSIDGEIWTIVSSSNDAMSWNKVIWAEGLSLFIACSLSTGAVNGDSNKIMTSADGLIWTGRPVPNSSLGYRCIAYSPLLNVVTALTTTISVGAYTSNGIDWVASSVTGGTTNHLSVIWAPKHGVFLGVSATTIIKSVDGFTWTLNNTFTTALNDIIWCEEIEKVVVVGPSSLIISSDLINWQNLSITRATSNFCRVTWSSKFNSIFLTYEGGVNCVMRYVDYKSTLLDSYDVINSSTWKNICWSPTLSIFVAVSDSGRDPFLISSDGNSWRRANFNSTRESLQIAGICWSPQLSLFVAVSRNGWKRALTSSNGDDWVERDTPGGIVNSWVDVCWSPELSIFVAVANAGTHRIMTSPDGANWTVPTTILERNVLNTLSLQNICWSPSLSIFVAVSNSTITAMNIMKSIDGINWTLHSAPIANLKSICWSPQLSLFVAVANAGTNRIIISKNGDSWTMINSFASSHSLENVIWTGVKFVIASFDTSNRGIIFESKDGLNWNQVYERTVVSNLQAIAYSQSLNKYVAVSNSGTDRIVSVGEVTGEQILTNSSIVYKESMNVLEYAPSDNTRNWTDVIYIPQQKRLVACCNNGTNGRIMISDNYGISWSSPSITLSSSLSSIAYGRFSPTWKMVAIQKSSTSNLNILGNIDGGTWSSSGFNFPMAECICSSEELSLFVVVRSSGTGRVNTSPDGTTWTSRTSADENSEWSYVVWSSKLSLFVAVARSGSTRVMTSANSIDWAPQTLSNGLELCAWENVCWSSKENLFVAVSSSGSHKMMKSSDGINWQAVSSPAFTSTVKRITWCEGVDMFTAILSLGSEKLIYSKDLINWETRVALNDTTDWNSICWVPDANCGIAVSNAPTSRVMRFQLENSPVWKTKPVVSIGDTTNSWNSVVWSPELELYVAVASSGVNRIMISEDGNEWILPSTVPAGVDSTTWQSVCWSSSLSIFVAVANNGTNRVMTSLDGLTWQLQVSTVADISGWSSVCWSEDLNMFIAVAQTGTSRIMYSSDGITWINTGLTGWNNSNGWTYVCWVPTISIFVALSSSGSNRIARSSDGMTWVNVTMPATTDSNNWLSACWSQELKKIVAVANSGNGNTRVMTSVDGVNWGLSISNNYINFSSIAWSAEIRMFVGVANAGTMKAMTSADGLTWNFIGSSNNLNNFTCVVWNKSLNSFIATASSGTNRIMNILVDRNNITPEYDISIPPRDFMVSYDTKSIVPSKALTVPIPRIGAGISVCWSPELLLFVAVTVFGVNRVMTSPDGITWTSRVSAGETNGWRDVCWSPELLLFVAVAASGTNKVMTSPDGITWTPRVSAVESNEWFSVCWSSELLLFVAVAVSGVNRVMTSPDGITWTPRVSAVETNQWYGVCWSPQRSLFVAVASSGTNKVMTSPDGITWTARVSAEEGSSWLSICWSPELLLFVAVANSGTNRVMASTNGIDWISQTSELDAWTDVCWSPQLSCLVVVGSSSSMFSSDGITWTSVPSTSVSLSNICWSPELSIFVTVGSSGVTNIYERIQLTTTSNLSAVETNSWKSICYSEELSIFVAISNDGVNRVMTSTDGVNWVSRTSAEESNGWIDVCWSPALAIFLAIAELGTNRIMTSSDGINWVSMLTTGESNQWSSVCWSPKLSIFVAVAITGANRVLIIEEVRNLGIVSAIGVNSVDSNEWRSVCWSEEDSVFLSVSSSGVNRVMYSLDGVNWYPWESTGENNAWQDVAWGKQLSQFASIASSGTNRLMTTRIAKETSINAIKRVSAGELNEWYDVSWSEELLLFVAVAQSGSGRVMSSKDGIKWETYVSNADVNEWNSVCWSPQRSIFVAVSSANEGGENRVMNITQLPPYEFNIEDLETTSTLSSVETNEWYGICWSEELSLFASVAGTGVNRIMTSPDGVNWTTRISAGDGNEWRNICWSPELYLFVAVATSGTNRVMTSSDGITWTLRVSAGEANAWRSVCWSPQLLLFVAVASSGTSRVMTSPNGQNWTARTSAGESNDWRDVCWSPQLSLFVAVARTGTSRVMTSPDGITWTARTSTANDWRGVCWSPELSLFVAVALAGTNRVMTSPNGITWTARLSAGESNEWYSVVWSSQLSIFVAVAGAGTNRVMISSDGINWVSRLSAVENNGWWGICWSPKLNMFASTSFSGVNRIMNIKAPIRPVVPLEIITRVSAVETNNWRSVCWSPELLLFVAVASSGTNRVMTSPDGITWTAHLSAEESNEWWSVCWSSELLLFVAVAQSGANRVMTSPDGITWTSRVSAGETNAWRSVCWGEELSLFVAVAGTGANRVMTSPDGVNWTPRVSASETNEWNKVIWFSRPSLFVAVSGSGVNRIMTSPDGITWTASLSTVSSSGENSWMGICDSPSLEIAVAVSNTGIGRVMNLTGEKLGDKFSNGLLAGETSLLESNEWRSICYSEVESRFVAVSSSGTNRVMNYGVDDLITVGRVSATEGNSWASVCWSEELSLFVAVAPNGANTVMTSPDGIGWTPRVSSSDTNGWFAVCWSPELLLFVAVANSGVNKVMTSPDGITWTGRISAVESNQWRSVCWSPDLLLFVAVANSGVNKVMISPDGINWTSSLSAVETNGWVAVCWSPELLLFVAVANSGTNRVMTSPDGITWTARFSAVESSQWNSVCWSPKLLLFVAVSSSGVNRIMTSPDGITWTPRVSAGEANGWYSVCWSPELAIFLAVANSGTNRVMISRNGSNWYAMPSSNEFNLWWGVCWSPKLSMFVSISYSTGTNKVMNITPPSREKYVVKSRLSSGETNSWWGVCRSEELLLFVAVAISGTNRVMTSTDGRFWTSRVSARETNSWRSVCWSPQLSLFVAVSSDGVNRVMTSANGVNWTIRTGCPGDWQNVKWIPQLAIFVAVANAGVNRIMTSKNGLVWTAYQSSNETNSWNSITWSPKLNMAVAVSTSGTDRVMNITDLGTKRLNIQSILSSAETNAWKSICWSEELSIFTAVSQTGTSRAMTSTDGCLWTTRSSTANEWKSICWSPTLSLFTAVSATGTNRVMTSPDGINWTLRASAVETNRWMSVTWSPQFAMFIAVSESGVNRVMVSNNGINWISMISSVETNGWQGICWSPTLSMFSAVSSSGVNRIMNLQQISYAPTTLSTSISSIDRIKTPVDTASWNSVSWSPKLGLFTALSSGNCVYSRDGIDWKQSLSTLPIVGSWQSICWSEELSLFLAVSSSGSRRVCMSKDGIRWDSYLSSTESNNWSSVVWSSELRMFIAVASSGTNRVMYSYDGVNWVSVVSANDSANWANICWSPDLHMFIAVANAGTGNRIMTSTNGTTWVSNSFASAMNWSGVCWSPLLKLFVIVSTSGTNRIAYSSNGVNWTQIASPVETATWYRVIWVPEIKVFISVSNSGEIMESFNGITWQIAGKQNSNYQDISWSPLLKKCIAVSSTLNYRITSMDLVEFPSEYENHLESIERVEVSGGEENNWSSLTWSPELGLFAGLAYLGNKRSMYSYDGVNWNVKLDNEIEDNGWVSSCWSPQLSLFVAVSFNGTGRVAISSNGKDWNTATTAHDAVEWRSVVWCEQLSVFVAVGSNGTNRVMRSSNGINWTRYSVELSNWHGIIWSPELSLFVAIADAGSGNRIMRSTNGISWTSTAQGKDNVWGYGAWSKELGLFVIVARSGTNRIAYSSDGVNWTLIASPLETANWRNIVWISEVGLFIVTSHSGHIMESDNGIDWRIISEQGVNYGSLAWSPLLRICIAGSWTLTERITIMKLRNSRLTTPTPTITSYDFGTYNNNFSIINSRATSITYSESLGLYVGVCNTGSRRFIYSLDSINWTSSILTTSSLNSSTWVDVCWNDSLSIFVAIANSGNSRIAKSADGKNWIEITPTDFSKSWTSIVSREAVLTGDVMSAMIVAVSSTGDVLRSIDGIDWTVSVGVNAFNWKCVVWGGDKFVAIDSFRTMISTDGINWQVYTNINTTWVSICHSNDLNRFVAVASNTNIAFSNDGINWELSPVRPSPGVWVSVSRSDSLGIFVASSNSNYIGISYDGLTWISKTVSFDSKLLSKIVWNEYKNKFFLCSDSISIMSSSLDLTAPPVLSLNSKVKWDLTWSSSIQMFMAFKKSDPLQNNQQLLLSSNGRSWITDTTNFTQAAKKSITSYTEIPNFSCLYMCRNTSQVQYVSPGGIGVISVSGFNVNCVFYSNPLGVLIMGNSNSNILLMANLLRTGGLQGILIQTQLPKIMTIGNIAVCRNNHIILENGETSTYYYSYDLNNFTLATLPSKAEWHFASKVIYNDDGSIYNDLVIGVSNTGFIIRSTNGINWDIVKNYNILESSGSRRFSNVKYIEELNAFVVCDEVRKTNCIVYTMDDGLTWVDVNLSSSASISDITFSAHLDSFLILSLPDGNGNLVSMMTLPKLPSGGNVMNKTGFNISPNGGLYTGEILTNTFLSNTLETMPLLALSTNSAYKPTTSTWTVNSDSRLKENIVDMDIDECLELIDKLELKYYKWKDEFSNNVEEEDKHKLGFIAQEVEALIPDAVYNIGNMYGYESVKSINQDQILAILYGAIQSLIIRYENIQKKLN